MWLLTPPPRPDDDQARAQESALAQLGVSVDDIAAQRRAEHPDDEELVLWAWHQQAVRLFWALRTQWRVISGLGGAGYVGLDYGVLSVLLPPLGLDGLTPDLLRELQTMEAAALRHLNRPAP